MFFLYTFRFLYAFATIVAYYTICLLFYAVYVRRVSGCVLRVLALSRRGCYPVPYPRARFRLRVRFLRRVPLSRRVRRFKRGCVVVPYVLSMASVTAFFRAFHAVALFYHTIVRHFSRGEAVFRGTTAGRCYILI